jgi:hypothetical protein
LRRAKPKLRLQSRYHPDNDLDHSENWMEWQQAVPTSTILPVSKQFNKVSMKRTIMFLSMPTVIAKQYLRTQ